MFKIYRIAEVVWSIDCSNPPISARAEVIFGYPEVQDYMGGDAMNLGDLPTFKKAWDYSALQWRASCISKTRSIIACRRLRLHGLTLLEHRGPEGLL